MIKNTQAKIWPYRVYKENGRYIVRINNKRVYIAHKYRKGKENTGERQIIRVVVNNLLAQRSTRRKKRTKKPVLAITSPGSEQPANGKSIPNGKLDLTKIPNSKTAEQAPTVDPLYANAGNKPSQLVLQDGSTDSQPPSEPPRSQPTDMYTPLIQALMMDQISRAQSIFGNIQPPNVMGEAFDVSQEPIDASQPIDPDLPQASPPPESVPGQDESGDMGIAGLFGEENVGSTLPVDPVENTDVEERKTDDPVRRQTRSKTDPIVKPTADFTEKNLVTWMKIVNAQKSRLYSKSFIKDKLDEIGTNTVKPIISSLYPNRRYAAELTLDEAQNVYAHVLITRREIVPEDIEPDVTFRSVRDRLRNTNTTNMTKKIVPRYLTEREKSFYNTLSSVDQKRQYLYGKIISSDDFNKQNWQSGTGVTIDGIKHEGMSSEEIAQVLKDRTHHVVPVIASDEIATLAPLVGPKTKQFGFIINSDPHSKPGHHWRAIFIDRSRAEVDYFDSLVSEPSPETLKGIKVLVDRFNDPLYYKLKVNRLKLQLDTSSNCGAFAIKFLEDRYSGKAFKESSGFVSRVREGEKSIRSYISKWAYI